MQSIIYGIYLCFGMPEIHGESLFNGQVLINPQGEIQAIHRKWNLKPAEEMANYQAGPVPLTITDNFLSSPSRPSCLVSCCRSHENKRTHARARSPIPK